ncbi:MAG: antitoxin family protein [Chloroflexi bacterium]|nr:antitoxin family protein [Chloroflexota bacterium]
MSIRVRARFSNGVLMPLEPLDLEEGREYVITIEYEPVPDRGAEGQPEEPAP